MRSWVFLLGGLIIWAIHFFALYVVASVFLTTPLARGLTLLLTLLCSGAVVFLLLRVSKAPAATDLERWTRAVALGGLGLSGVAVVWQGLPALLI